MTDVEILKVFGPLIDLHLHPQAPDEMMLVLTTTDGGIIDTSNRLNAGALRNMQAAVLQSKRLRVTHRAFQRKSAVSSEVSIIVSVLSRYEHLVHPADILFLAEQIAAALPSLNSDIPTSVSA
jgi:hypothetical protein